MINLYPELEEKYMRYHDLTKSALEPSLEAVLGIELAITFPYPWLLKNLSMYDLERIPMRLIAQPPNTGGTYIPRSMYWDLYEWGHLHDLYINVDDISPFLDGSHVIEIGLNPDLYEKGYYPIQPEQRELQLVKDEKGIARWVEV